MHLFWLAEDVPFFAGTATPRRPGDAARRRGGRPSNPRTDIETWTVPSTDGCPAECRRPGNAFRARPTTRTDAGRLIPTPLPQLRTFLNLLKTPGLGHRECTCSGCKAETMILETGSWRQ